MKKRANGAENLPRLGLSIEETARILGCGRSKIYELIGSRDLIARKVGRRTLILKTDLDAFLRNLPRADFSQPGRVA